MEVKKKTPRSPLLTLFHFLHVCVSIGLIITVFRYQLVNESRLEKLEKSDCKCGSEVKSSNAQSAGEFEEDRLRYPQMKGKPDQNGLLLSRKTRSAANKTRNLDKEQLQLLSCLDELKTFVEKYKKSIKTDTMSMNRCDHKLLQGIKGERGEKGAIGPKGCPGTFMVPPTVDPSSHYLVFNEGDDAILSCNATANPPAQITWYREDLPIRMRTGNASYRYRIRTRNINPLAFNRSRMCPSDIPHTITQSTLVIKRSHGLDTGIYSCEAHNILGVNRYRIKVLVQVHVQFVEVPSNLTFIQGDEVRFSCQASGVPTPVITWYRKDGGPMPTQYNATGECLHIHQIRKEEEGTFVCLATNILGSKTTEATITVNVFPKITSFLDQPITINESQTLVLPCNATGYPSPDIRWSKINESLAEGRYVYDSQVLKLRDVKYDDRGEYVCTANNTVGSVFKKIAVVVQVGPKIIRRPSVTEFGYRSLTKIIPFEVFAWPLANVTWKRPFWNTKADARFRQAEKGDLIVKNVHYTDSGRYQVTARNILGEVNVTTFLVVSRTVHPFFKQKLPTNITLELGGNYSIECEVDGVPSPKIVWKHSAGILTNSTMNKEKILRIISVNQSHAGRYTCIADNGIGVVQQHVNIRVPGFLEIRLAGSVNNYEGRVEVYHDGRWGTVCDDSWDKNDARVVCRQLGFRDAQSAPHSASFGQGSGTTWMDDVNCKGDENRIQDCGHSGWGIENCSHSEDASVVCLYN